MYQGFFSAAVLVSSPDMIFAGDVNYEGITRPHIQYNHAVHVYIYRTQGVKEGKSAETGICSRFGCRDNSSFMLNNLGPLCL